MQALRSESSPGCRIIEFPNLMGTTANTGPSGHDPQIHGNSAQIVSAIGAILAILLSALNLYLLISWRSGEKQTQSSDEHVNTLIEKKLSPSVQTVNEDIDRKLQPLTPLSNRLSTL